MHTRYVRLAALTVAAGACAALAATAAPAYAANTLNVVYDASGTTLVKKPNSTLTLGPTQLTNHINGDGTLTAQLPIPPTTSTFTVIGLLPAKATVTFIPVGDTVGRLTSGSGRTVVTATSQYYIKLTNVTLAGLPTFVGNKCQTKDPVTIATATPASETFNVNTGGHLTGTYTIGKFANCGLTTGIVNSLVPGSGNTVSFTLSNGRIVP